jgi:hypothetical protein
VVRDATRLRTTARCHGCGRVAAGITTSQAHLREWGQFRSRDFHRCDDCLSAIRERPLRRLLAELVNENVPW